jgi:YVTN family beta-propeller protein
LPEIDHEKPLRESKNSLRGYFALPPDKSTFEFQMIFIRRRMTMRRFILSALLVTAVFLEVNTVSSAAPFAYISTLNNSVLKIDTATNTLAATVTAGTYPYGIAVSPYGTRVYVTNLTSATVSVIDTITNTLATTVVVGQSPRGVAISPDGATVYVANNYSGANGNSLMVIDTTTNKVKATVGMIQPVGVVVSPNGKKVYVTRDQELSIANDYVLVVDTATNTLAGSIEVGRHPAGIAIAPDGVRVYVVNNWSNTVSVINTATNTVTATVPVGSYPLGVAVSPDGTNVYVTNSIGNTVSVINTATNTLTATVNVGSFPFGVAITPDGRKVFVANRDSSNVSVITTGANIVSATLPVGSKPFAFGQFIIPVDTTVTLVDAILALQIITGTTPYSEINTSVEVNGDGKIGMEEVIYILQKVAGAR